LFVFIVFVSPKVERALLSLVSEVAADIGSVSPATQVVAHALEIRDAWDFEEVYGALFDFAKRYRFDPENEDYWIHITTGTHVVQICMLLMTEVRFFAGRLAPAALVVALRRTERRGGRRARSNHGPRSG
jgi:sigma54-dependent transcription regulator